MAGTNYKPPTLHDITVPDVFTLIAKENPDRDFVQVLREHQDGSIDSIRYTWAQVIQHAQNAAADIRTRWASGTADESAKLKIGQPREPGSSPVVVAILAKNGYELYVNIIACFLNRWAVLLISPKNSPAAVEHLLQTSASSLFLVEPSNIEFGHARGLNVPGLAVLSAATLGSLAGQPSSSPLSPLTPEQLKREMSLPALYIHTSGSTGHPKIITWSHEFFLGGARVRHLGGDDENGRPCYSIAPLFHSMGMFTYGMFVFAHAYLITFVSSPTSKPPSAAALLQYLPYLKDGLVAVPPSILEELYNLGSEAVKEMAEGLHTVLYGGAPLKKQIGDALVAMGLRILNGYGSTEIRVATKGILMKDPKDWEYVAFNQGLQWHWLPVDDHSNLRELVAGPSSEGSPAVINHENPLGFATNDIWEPHPSTPGLWRHHSRAGDVTVLSNGEKTDNKQIEGLLLVDQRIAYVLVFGARRAMNGVILQPKDTSMPASEFLSQIQPTIEHANTVLPTHSRLVPELILVAPPNKLFATTDKGTIRRNETINKFEQEIDAAYESLEEGGSGEEGTFEGNVSDVNDVKEFVRSAIRKVLDGDVPDGEDLFEHGLDSLLSQRLRAALVPVVKKTVTSTQPVPRNIVYSYPSINALTTYLLSRALLSSTDSKGATEERIRYTIAKYSSNFVPHVPGSRPVNGKVVAMSGSTGSVGSSMLALLLERDDVEKVYLLNRKGNEGQEIRQARGFKERGLDPSMLENKRENLVYLDVDFSKPDLGLTNKDYEDLRDNVTHIIHSAWHLNFNLILESYERVHIAGVRHLIDLALSSPHSQSPRLTFLSSVSAAAMYRGPSEEPVVGETAGQVLVPEEAIEDPSIALNQGYGQGKYVSERMLVHAVEAGLRTSIVRVGQLSGVTTNGAWASSEHVPTLFKSSIALGIAPMDLPPVRWVPSDVAASAIIKQAFQDDSPLQYFSVENPASTPWITVANALAAASPKPLKSVPLTTWLKHIRENRPDPHAVPAVRLLDFYQGIAAGGEHLSALGWEKSVRVAPELNVGRLSEDLVAKYVRWQMQRETSGV